MKPLADHSVDDSCLFCPAHIGHYFNAHWDKDFGQYRTGEGWLVIEHINGCYIFICPHCFEGVKELLLGIRRNARKGYHVEWEEVKSPNGTVEYFKEVEIANKRKDKP